MSFFDRKNNIKLLFFRPIRKVVINSPSLPSLFKILFLIRNNSVINNELHFVESS
ncbi:hypothetical protein SAMN05444412_10863 [Rhodonellum ikkaensis]|uniref:Uncharacterized protein n=1 Tax=Rhodonellum ikkaensis TaxID=336829 RepID=A0A1H3RE11_9BACT|nr:hypothetical protein SAMN05444412_10863 [Rhodonellum ikkaensis]